MATGCLAGAACIEAEAPAVAAVARPVFAHTVVLKPISGEVRIDIPNTRRGFVRLTAERAVPTGTVVDTTAGKVALTSANPSPAPAPLQTGQFFRGIFRVQQSSGAGGLVDLVIRDTLSRSVCAAGAARASALSHRVLGLLRGVANGRFRTTGRFGAATVRGTNWGVRDRCDGTLTVVREGLVIVRDFILHRDVIVRAGQTYLARAA
jgi:hypothetical protein